MYRSCPYSHGAIPKRAVRHKNMVPGGVVVERNEQAASHATSVWVFQTSTAKRKGVCRRVAEKQHKYGTSESPWLGACIVCGIDVRNDDIICLKTQVLSLDKLHGDGTRLVVFRVVVRKPETFGSARCEGSDDGVGEVDTYQADLAV